MQQVTMLDFVSTGAWDYPSWIRRQASRRIIATSGFHIATGDQVLYLVLAQATISRVQSWRVMNYSTER